MWWCRWAAPPPIFTLNETGAFLWKQLGADISREELIARLTAEYEVTPEQAATDVEAFLQKLRTNHFLAE